RILTRSPSAPGRDFPHFQRIPASNLRLDSQRRCQVCVRDENGRVRPSSGGGRFNPGAPGLSTDPASVGARLKANRQRRKSGFPPPGWGRVRVGVRSQETLAPPQPSPTRGEGEESLLAEL